METIDSIIIEIDNLKTIFNICDDALENHKIIAIISKPGLGKTTALVTYSYTKKDNVVIVQVGKSVKPRVFFSSIYNEIGDENYDPGIPLYFIIRKAASIFNQGKNMLLIIDEVGKFSPTMIEYLHEFRNLTRGNTGIILSGPPSFKNSMVKWNASDKSGMPEFYSRISSWQYLELPTLKEISAILKEYKIFDPKFEKENSTVKSFRELKINIDEYFYKKRIEEMVLV
jgi:type II secretory pathway predicted ATPase ExeA